MIAFIGRGSFKAEIVFNYINKVELYKSIKEMKSRKYECNSKMLLTV